VAEPTQPAQRMIVGHFIVSNDVERSRRFYTEVLGGKVIFGPDPTNIALANNYIITDTGGAPPTTRPRSPSRPRPTLTG
jgi:catechol 2,3-dioxygenase-like lactoylglutathione lyase family enzyme